ncbi:pleckstrin homology domain-containing family G member 3 isoform X2 [Mastacembelus armatus]|uniref:Pleckstrin homology domain-containing family G member 3-like n=1 Tax=Mastacembelus armatus TaxID=205130 RepID=A0A3Q3L1D0_9TELE|nr:pleckstrin homology domain-containing family G member 3-like isoform X2 [Mastacembelus armatus]
MPEGSHSSSHDASMGEESPRLSTASISSNERAPSTTPSDSSDLASSDRRPVSLISTLSSGSGSSRDETQGFPALSIQPSDPNVDLDPCPTGGAADSKGSGTHLQPDQRGRSLDLINNNKASTTNRVSRRWQQASPFVTSSMAPNPQLTYLDRVVMEILETERMYVRDLRMIVEDYLAHIIDQSDLSIRPEQVCALFGNIEDIYEFNSELLQDLDLCDNDPVAIARCFVMKSEYFEIYTQYCTNYPNSVAALTECMRNKSLAKFFRERQGSLKRSLPLGSYLLKPVQRILKYHLLLQEIAKHFDPEEEGYEVVEEAIQTMTGVAWYINEMKRKHEHAVRLQEVQSLLLNWKGPDLTTYGELVLEGTFKVHRAKNERTLFLFDRVLLITKRRGEHYIYKAHISCSTLMLIESAKDALSFSVTHYKHPKQPHTVQAKTVEEKKLWAHHIKRLILENHHAVIPQKAKEAILEMDSIYPPRYRYSPERLKKAASAQPEGFQREARWGRRQSEQTAILKEAEGGNISANRSDKENGQLPEKDASVANEPIPEQVTVDDLQPSTDKLPQEKMSDSEPTENLEAETTSDLESLRISVSPQGSDLQLEGDAEPTEEPLSATPDSDSKTLSSGESSEDEEDEKEAAEKEGEATSILPSSVLDKASAIAQHFTGSIRRGSLSQEDTRSLSCASPRLPSRTGSSLSLSAELIDRPLRLNSICSDPTEGFSTMDLTLLSPRDDCLVDTDRGIRRRRDSTLSKQDQLLIGKIKNYYENAGNQDVTFSLQRRESLTYIPTGLVKSSISRFNGFPKDETDQTNVLTTSSRFDSSSRESHATLPTDAQDHIVSSDSLDSLKSGQRSTEQGNLEGNLRSISQTLQYNPSDEEEFRPSSEMIKIWQVMEQGLAISQSEDSGHKQPKEASENTRSPRIRPTKTLTNSCDQESGASDLSTITEESISPSPVQLRGLKQTLKVFGEDAFVLRASVPRIVQLKAEAEGKRSSENSNQGNEVDKTKSKVLHLARQYSQRIKTTKPVVQQQSHGILIRKKSLPCLVEEKESSGKAALTLPLVSHNKATSLPVSPVDQIPSNTRSLTCSLPVSPGRAETRSARSPPPPIEGFHWPDVQELRSKYSNHSRSENSSVSRSCSNPEQMFEGLRRHSSCSSSLHLTMPSSKNCSDQDASREDQIKRVHRANSLDPQLSGTQETELQKLQDHVINSSYNGYYIAAEAPLSSDPEHKIIVMEKIPEPESEPAEITKEEGDGSYIQIRSPTSREKISIMAVIDRCRAYQESDEYKQREEAKAKTESLRSQDLNKVAVPSSDQDVEPQTTRSTSRQKTESGPQSNVKHLRDKFQSLS